MTFTQMDGQNGSQFVPEFGENGGAMGTLYDLHFESMEISRIQQMEVRKRTVTICLAI